MARLKDKIYIITGATSGIGKRAAEVFALLVLLSSAPVFAQGNVPGVTLANTEQRAITSTKIGQRYDLLVSLPEDYATSGKVYPVLYVLDGWHFPLMAFLQSNSLYSKRMPPVITVNISHGTTNEMALRLRDFTPIRVANEPGSGGAPLFLEFFEKDVVPFVERTYRTIPTDRALLGHSLGGLFALYALEHRPALFQRIVAASPSVQWRNHAFFPTLDRFKGGNTPVRLDLSHGDEEPGGVAAFVKLLDEAKLANVDYRFTVYRGENHNSVRLVSFPAGLYWVYKPLTSTR